MSREHEPPDFPDEDPDDLPLSELYRRAGFKGEPTMEELEAFTSLNPKAKKIFERYRSLRAQKLNRDAKIAGSLQSQDPLHFAMSILGMRPSEAAKLAGYRSPLTPDIVRVMLSVRDHRKTAVTSGHGTGKTHGAAIIALWLLYSVEDTIIVTTATSWSTVEKQIWAEIHERFAKAKLPLPGHLTSTDLKLGPKWFATGFSTNEPERVQGFHSKRVIVIIDEATGYPEDLWDSLESLIVGPNDRILAMGNPTNIASKFKRVCDSGSYNLLRLDGYNHPNVLHGDPYIILGAISREWIADRRLEYGSEDAPMFLARVRGVWPPSSTDTLISQTAIESAQQWDERHVKDIEFPPDLRALPRAPSKNVTHEGKGVGLGIDIAGPGSDLCVCTETDGGRIKILWWLVHRELMETVGRLIRTIRSYNGRARALAIDDTGIGNGVSSRLMELQQWARDDLYTRLRVKEDDSLILCNIIRVNFAEESDDKSRFHRMKDQLWWQLREDLNKEVRGLPPEPELKALTFPRGVSMSAQLVAPIYEVHSSGAIIVYDRRHGNREKTKNLPTRSPDVAHSIILSNHAYRFIRTEKGIDPPKDIPEMRRRSFAEHIRSLLKKRGDDDDSTTDPYKYLNV